MADDGRVPDDTVSVVPHDPGWARRFAQAATTLRRVLPEALLIEHVGSTAVPGLAARDSVDVMVVIDDLGLVRERAPALAVAGFDLRLGSSFTSDDHLFLRRVVDHHRTHHVHALLPSSPAVTDYLLLRDYLRADADAAARYGEAKIRLAAEHRPADDGGAAPGPGADRNGYVRAKPMLVAAVMADARAWAAATRGA